MREEIFISGFGGQGIVLAGELLAKAAMLKGYYAIVTKFYGAEVRGGPVSSGVIISDEEIIFQFVRKPDYLLALHESGIKAHAPKAVKTAIVDEELVHDIPVSYENVIKVPIIRTAEQVGSQTVANVVLLGVFSTFSDLISIEDLKKAVEYFVREKYLGLNIKALEAGVKLVKR